MPQLEIAIQGCSFCCITARTARRSQLLERHQTPAAQQQCTAYVSPAAKQQPRCAGAASELAQLLVGCLEPQNAHADCCGLLAARSIAQSRHALLSTLRCCCPVSDLSSCSAAAVCALRHDVTNMRHMSAPYQACLHCALTNEPDLEQPRYLQVNHNQCHTASRYAKHHC